MIKDMDEENISIVVTLFNRFLEARKVPDEMNTALLRLLPKTADGLSNLDKTRPITLMETLMKLYERVIIGRVMKVVEEKPVLDKSQFGALPNAGTAEPLRALAEVLDDARVSKQELHIIALDLKKAFDTVEYWSQALSWRAVGVPTEAIKVLAAGRLEPPVLRGSRAARPMPTSHA